MYYALSNNQPVRANEEALKPIVARASHYQCVKCGRPVQLITSRHRRPYFKHAGTSNSTPAESAWHAANKRWLAAALARAGYVTEMERHMPDGERRADVYVLSKGGAYTIELQSSLIPAEEVRRREQDYQKHQLEVLWLLNEQQPHYQWYARNFQRLVPFLRMNLTFGVYLPYWDAIEERVSLISVDGFGHIVQRWLVSISDYIAMCDADDSTLPELTHGYILPDAKSYASLQLLQRHTRLLRQPTRADKQLLRVLYQQRIATDALAYDYFRYDYPCVFVQEKLHHVLIYMTLLRKLNISRADYRRQLVQWLHFRPFNPELQVAVSQWLNTVWQLSKRVENQIASDLKEEN
ncbi:MAG: hypothetical protein MR008_02930 [Aerococcus sp.]|nr:hypothetical protein [Aerococcus sp.]